MILKNTKKIWNISTESKYHWLLFFLAGGSPHGIMDNVLDCDIISEFELQSDYYVHF